MTSFTESPIVALSYFYDRLEPLGLNGTFTIATLATLAADVCAGPATWEAKFPKHKFPKALAELNDRPESCLDLTFQHALLSLGYDLAPSRSVTVAKKLAGSELGWCAGAQLMTVSRLFACLHAFKLEDEQLELTCASFTRRRSQLEDEGHICKR